MTVQELETELRKLKSQDDIQFVAPWIPVYATEIRIERTGDHEVNIVLMQDVFDDTDESEN